MTWRLSLMVTEVKVRDVQEANAYLKICVTLFGMVTEVK